MWLLMGCLRLASLSWLPREGVDSLVSLCCMIMVLGQLLCLMLEMLLDDYVGFRLGRLFR